MEVIGYWIHERGAKRRGYGWRQEVYSHPHLKSLSRKSVTYRKDPGLSLSTPNMQDSRTGGAIQGH